jgi:hypothetical protein
MSSLKDITNSNEETETQDEFKPLILIATTHGCVPCDSLGMYNTINVPNGMEFVKISIAYSGKRCAFNSRLMNTYISMINYFNPLLISKNLNDNSYDLLLKILNNQIFKRIKDDQKKMLEYAINSNKFKVGIDDEGEYVTTGGFKVHILKSGSLIANKLYQRQFGDKRGNDFSIVELEKPESKTLGPPILKPVENLPDLFSIKYPHETYSHDFTQSVRLNDILNYYVSIGITRLIFFDFTCSSFLDGLNHCCDESRINEIRDMNIYIPTGGKKYKIKSHKIKKRKIKKIRKSRISRRSRKSRKNKK